RALERKWQKKWAWAKVDETDPDPRQPKYFVTAAYPYPNSPQHIGHARTYTIADANARFHRMRGYNTLYPMGFHYTGTPLYAMAKRLSQNDPEISDSHLVKFESNGTIYPTATLRPETIFGVTNIWVNPNTRYVKAQVDSEEWVVSREATETLEHQNHSVRIETELSGTDLLWKEVVNPMTNTAVPVLPADFVEPDNGTGIVMSVPGHAPYDYQALMDLKTRSWTSSQPE